MKELPLFCEKPGVFQGDDTLSKLFVGTVRKFIQVPMLLVALKSYSIQQVA
jgi:hypothetical protein